MGDLEALSVLLVSATALVLVLYVFSRVEVEFGPKGLVLRWLLLGGFPFQQLAIEYDNIAAVERFAWRRHWRRPFLLFLGGRAKPANDGRLKTGQRS